MGEGDMWRRLATLGACAAIAGAAALADCRGAWGATITQDYIPPSLNTDGSPLTDLAGVRFYCRQTFPISSGYELAADQTDPTAVTITFSISTQLSPGENTFLCFGEAYNSFGETSAPSNKALHRITVTLGQTPAAPAVLNSILTLEPGECPAGFVCEAS